MAFPQYVVNCPEFCPAPNLTFIGLFTTQRVTAISIKAPMGHAGERPDILGSLIGNHAK